MDKEYSPKNIENYVQNYWKKNKTFEVYEDSKKQKYYCLPMLPYPSGKLHMGHVRNYTISDVISRYQRMLGKNVLQPIGWDAFGLPAEEAALKNHTNPEQWTNNNIKYMKKQLQLLGFSYDWNREITTCKPEYYHWEQWFFTKLYEKKMVYKKNSLVNWCSYDKTVLANEQVINGCCWRCNSKIKTKKISQWFIKIRKYAESLYNDLDKLNDWPEKVKNMQRNWIGRSKGFEINLNIFKTNKNLKVFTTKLYTIVEATYIAISPFHELALELSKKNQIIKLFITKQIKQDISEDKKNQEQYEGRDTHLFALHPITEKKIPIWIANFVVKEYGTGAVISVPLHNKNDFNFAIKHNLKIKNTKKDIKLNSISLINQKKILSNNIKEKNTLNDSFSDKIIKKILLHKNILETKIHYKLQDWCISRQRYWGAPIPMATLENGTIIPIPENQLPVLLPPLKRKIQKISNILNSNSKWANIRINNQKAIRETDTFDTFMESSWYYARYTCPHFHAGMIDPNLSNYWLPVDQYIGGIEHAIMHLMYFRFYHKLLRDFKLINFEEPVKNLICQGMVLSEAFYTIGNNSQMNWINSSSILIKRNSKGKFIKSYTKEGKEIIYAGMIKMSKSKNNGIEPKLMINRYGADTVRLFIMFAAPIESSLEWKESGVKGIHRFLTKLWKLIYFYINTKHTAKEMNFHTLNKKQIKLRYSLNLTIKKVSDDIDRRKTFNTAIAAIMAFVNQLIKQPIITQQDKSIMRESLIAVIKMLHPFTPHFCFIIWKYFNNNCYIDYSHWPVFNKKILCEKNNTLIVQINGKTRCIINISKNLTKKEIFCIAKNKPIIQKYLKNVNIKNTIYIDRKVLNFLI